MSESGTPWAYWPGSLAAREPRRIGRDEDGETDRQAYFPRGLRSCS
jgi:hypothetical protein